MSAQSDGGLGGGAASELYQNVTCPFCGLLCDDLEVARTGSTLKVVKNGCPRSAAGFERTLPAAKPMVDGKEVDARGGHRGRRGAHQGRQAPALRRHGHRRRRRARRHVAGRPLLRRRRPRAERRPVPQHQGRADERLDHLHAHRDAQPRRPDRRSWAATCTSCTSASSSASSVRPNRCSRTWRRSAPSSSSARGSTPRRATGPRIGEVITLPARTRG